MGHNSSVYRLQCNLNLNFNFRRALSKSLLFHKLITKKLYYNMDHKNYCTCPTSNNIKTQILMKLNLNIHASRHIYSRYVDIFNYNMSYKITSYFYFVLWNNIKYQTRIAQHNEKTLKTHDIHTQIICCTVTLRYHHLIQTHSTIIIIFRTLHHKDTYTHYSAHYRESVA